MAGGMLLPIAGHKGYGLATAITLLTGMLGEAEVDEDIPHPYKELGAPGVNTFLMAALRIDSFADPDAFRKRSDQWRARGPARGHGPG